MRRFILAVLMINLILLSACSDTMTETESVIISFRENLTLATDVNAEVLVTANMDTEIREYRLAFWCGDNVSSVKVLEPSIIAGVKATIDGETGTIEYQDLLLDTGEFLSDEPTAVTAMHIVMDAILNGHIDTVWTEENVYCAKIILTDELAVELILDKSTKNLINAEIIDCKTGEYVINCDVETFELTFSEH